MSIWNGKFRSEEEMDEYHKKVRGKGVICKAVYPKEGKLCDKCRFRLKNKKIFEFFEDQLQKYNEKRR
jgi:hypothetical protein